MSKLMAGSLVHLPLNLSSSHLHLVGNFCHVGEKNIWLFATTNKQKGTWLRTLEEDQWTKLQPQLGPLGQWVQFQHFVILCFVGVRMNMDFDFELVFLL
jgi:hypothetical protein